MQKILDQMAAEMHWIQFAVKFLHMYKFGLAPS